MENEETKPEEKRCLCINCCASAAVDFLEKGLVLALVKQAIIMPMKRLSDGKQVEVVCKVQTVGGMAGLVPVAELIDDKYSARLYSVDFDGREITATTYEESLKITEEYRKKQETINSATEILPEAFPMLNPNKEGGYNA